MIYPCDWFWAGRRRYGSFLAIFYGAGAFDVGSK